nr:3-isopropylmalate dehydratase [Cellvibrionaceae bacterium]
MNQTLFEKLWQSHQIKALGNREYLINIDRIFLHERTGSIALLSLAQSGRQLASPQNVFCTMDHIVSTRKGRGDKTEMPGGEKFISATRQAATEAGIHLFDINHPRQGIVHVISPELGIAQPGITLVCPDSHTCTLGGLGALAWGIGSTAAEHAMATNTLRVVKPRTMRIHCHGQLAAGVSAKDLIIHIIGQLGTAAGSGYAVEFAGAAIRALDIESRLTLCNMAVELSAFTGLIAPDDKTVDYLFGKLHAPKGEAWAQA